MEKLIFFILAIPILIFIFVAYIDLPVAAILVCFALLALFLPAFWHSYDVKNSKIRQYSYATFASEFLDSIQGLATLKALIFRLTIPLVEMEKKA